MLAESMIQLKEVTLNVAEGPPSGSPLLLIHGGGNRWQVFLPIISTLALRWHIYTPDLRGHGKSEWLTGYYRPEHYTADVMALVDEQALDQLVLFGHSLGGWIALKAAARLGGKVKALILGDPPINIERFVADEGQADRVEMWRALRDLASSELGVSELASAVADMPISTSEVEGPVRYGDLPGVSSIQIRAWANDLHRLDPDVARYHAEGRLSEYVECVDVDKSLKAIDCPVLLIQGDPSKGGVVTDEDAEHALALLSDGLHIRFDNVGHDLGLGSWKVDQLLMAVMSILESL